MLLFPESTHAGMQRVLNDLQIPEIAVLGGRGGRASIKFSWGAATWPDNGQDPAALLQVADARLYAMKQARKGSYM